MLFHFVNWLLVSVVKEMMILAILMWLFCGNLVLCQNVTNYTEWDNTLLTQKLKTWIFHIVQEFKMHDPKLNVQLVLSSDNETDGALIRLANDLEHLW